MEMIILQCANCGNAEIPPKYACPKCLSEQMIEKQASGKGDVYSHTVIHIAPEQFASKAPYQVVLVAMDHGLRVTGRIKEGKASIGERVELDSLDQSVYWFRITGE